MGKCKTGLKRRTSSLHVQHLGLNHPDTGQAACGHLLRLFDAVHFQRGFATPSKLLADGSKASGSCADLLRARVHVSSREGDVICRSVELIKMQSLYSQTSFVQDCVRYLNLISPNGTSVHVCRVRFGSVFCIFFCGSAASCGCTQTADQGVTESMRRTGWELSVWL